MNATVLVLNGPNLNRLGTREPEIYGSTTFSELTEICERHAQVHNLKADVRQTNSEAELIGWLHEAADAKLPVVLNPAAFTHYSYAVRDACSMLTAPLIEVHISNPSAREEFRHNSVISGVALGTIAGFGMDSYRIAIEQIARLNG